MFYLESNNKADCCGCSGCEQVCPTSCISMIEDEEGFRYPIKDEELCIHCGLCEVVCPNVNKEKITDSQEYDIDSKAFFAVHKDEDILDKSASGGVFSAIVDSFCDHNFVIFGVEFDEDLQVIHSYTDNIRDSEKYRKSKYVQSDINGTYKDAEKFLKQGKKVLFTGTPCQIGGLKLYLRKDYDNLFCADLVCHGVPNQSLFDRYIKELDKKHNGKVSSYTFRHKTKSGNDNWNSRNVKYEINKKKIIENSQKDSYLRGYHPGLYYRPSCYDCKYSNPERVSDITMADFWGVEELFPNENVHKGVSVFLANTKKGQSLVYNMSKLMKIKEVDKEFVIKSNAQLNRPAKLHPKREQFFKILDKRNFDQAVNECIPQPTIVRRIASRILPKKIKNLIKKINN